MMIEIHMTHDSATFRLLGRGQLVKLAKREVETLDENDAVRCWVKWHPENEWEPLRLLTVRKASIAYTVALSDAVKQAFLAAHAPELADASVPA